MWQCFTRKDCVEMGTLPPWYYGLAYYDECSMAGHFYPIPINYLVRWAKLLQWRWNRWRGQSPYVIVTRETYGKHLDRRTELVRKQVALKERDRKLRFM